MRWIWWVVLVVALLAGCAEQGPRLVVAPDRLELAPGEEQAMAARLEGLEGEVVWTAEHGVIIGQGLQVVYRAPDYPVEDVITVISKDDPRLRAEARVIVSGSGELGPRIEIASDLALIFSQVGEQRRVRARVYDAAGRLLTDARPTFVSTDPQSFAIDYDEEGNAIVTALSDEVQSVPLIVRYQDQETRAVAVFTHLQPGVVRLPADLLLSGDWQSGGWASLVLKRTPETEALEPGTIFFSGDAGAFWGRIDAVELADGSVTLITSPARLEEIFSDLDYRAQTPPFRVSASWSDGHLRADAGGRSYVARLESCNDLTADLSGEEELTAEAGVNLRIVAGQVQEGSFYLDLNDALSSPVELVAHGEQGDCQVASWRTKTEPVSLLVARVSVSLESRLGLFFEGASGAELRLPAAPLSTRARIALRYQDGSWLPSFQTEQKAQAPAAAPGVERAEGELEAGLRQDFSAAVRLILPGEDADLAEPAYEVRLPWKFRLAMVDPEHADYSGSSWELERRLKTVIAGSEQTTGELLARSPQTWLESDHDRANLLDLGSLAEGRALHLTVGSEPQGGGEAEVWIEGGVCDGPEECFDGSLRLLGQAELPAGQVVWRPGKDERGVYRAYARLREDAFSQQHPYAAAPQTLVVTGPDLSNLPLELTLRGGYGGPALGVISYFNQPLWGVAPDGQRVQLTSPLQVWIPANGLSADPASLVTAPASWGYQQISYHCPRSGQVEVQKLHIFSNDPEMAEVVLPVRVRCDATSLPQPFLRGRPAAGAAPLRVELEAETRGTDAANWCRLDFGDGSQPRDWPAGECPQKTTMVHTYERPGSYLAILLVGDADGARVLARTTIEVK